MIYLTAIFGFVLRLISINQSFWLDEATSALVSRDLSFSDIITKFSPGDFHPPLYYLFLKWWSGIFGYSELSLRFPSIIFGVLTIYLIYLIGKEMFNKKAGLIASLFLATSGLHIYYSQEARMYSMATFFIALSVFSYLKLIKEIDTYHLTLFSLTLTTAIFTDYLSILIIPIFIIWPLISKKNWIWRKMFLVSFLLPLAISIIWTPTFLKQLLLGINVNSSLPGWWNILGITNFKNLALIPAKFILGRVSPENNYVYGFIFVVLVAAYGWIMSKSKSSTFLWFWLLIPILGMALLGFFIPVVYYFRILFVLPAFFLLLSFGSINLENGLRKIVIGLVLCVNLVSSFVYLTQADFQREDWRSAVKYVESTKSEGGMVVFPSSSGTEAYRYYAPDAKITDSKGLDQEYSQIWLFSYLKDVFDPGYESRNVVEKMGYKLVSEKSFQGIGSVYLYEK